MKTISRYIMTLALLLTAVTGAWADETLLTTINASSDFISGSKTFEGVATVTITGNIACDEMSNMCWSAVYGSSGGSVTVEPAEGTTISSCKFYFDNNETYTISTAPFVLYPTMFNGSSFQIYTGPNCTGEQLYGSEGIKKIEVYAPAEPPITVEPVTGQQNQWTFAMPGSDVVLTPLYAPAAKWDVVENLEQLPAALEGIIAGQDAAIVTAGQSAQGTVMYAVTTSAEAAPELSAFSATVPTAKDYDDATTLYVWYYIQGKDTPDGQEATEENTFNDTEICTTPLTVQVLTNKFDIQLNAANANTIEATDASKATVTVDGTDKTGDITDGKLQGVKMGSEVKLKAKPGYKFRKVEVKKKETPSLSLTNPTVGQVIGSDGKNYDADATLPSGVNKVAMIAYVSGSNGLAIALADEGRMDWITAVSTAAAHTPVFSNGTWKLPTRDEWKQMFNANGGSDSSWAGLNEALAAAGDDNSKLQVEKDYWSSSEINNDRAYSMLIGKNSTDWGQGNKTGNKGVRACLAF